MLKNLLFTLALIFVTTLSFAVTKTYTGPTSGNWNTGSNWSPSGVPANTDDVIIPSGYTVTINANATANNITVSGELNLGNTFQLTVKGNFTVSLGGEFNMPANSGFGILVVYGNFNNNGETYFWKSWVVIAGDLTSTSTSSIQNQGNVSVGGNITGLFDTTGGTGLNQIYAPNPASIVTISPSSIDSNVTPGVGVTTSTESQAYVDLVNSILYGNTCSAVNSTANVLACAGSAAVFTATSTSTAPTLQWQVNMNNGSGWVNLTNTTPYSGVTSTYLNISSVSIAMANYKYRAQFTSGGCAAYGSYGVLTVNSVPSAPTLGSISAPSCGLSNGSVVLSGLPASGTWTLNTIGTANGVTTGTGTSTTVSGLGTGNYTFTVSNGGCSSVTSASAALATITNSWNGSSWSRGFAPSGTDNIVINGDYTAAGNLTGCTLTINSGALIISSPYSMTLTNAVTVNGGSLTIKSGASLVQTNNAAVNTGNIVVERMTTIRKTDYVYWSSPVANFSSSAISPLTTGYVYKWNPSVANANGGQGNWQGGSEVMSLAKGYIVRGPDAFNSTPAAFTASFTGVPNNGIIQAAISRGTITNNLTGTNGAIINSFDDNWNLLGNPYPSAISATAFLAANTNIAGNVRLWTHGTAIAAGGSTFYGSFAYNYSANDYVNYNAIGSTPPGFNGKIGAGQGFFVNMNEATAVNESVTFNNSMRSSAYSNTQFYRNANVMETEPAVDHIWVSLLDGTNVARTTLVGYTEDATVEKDRMYDAPHPLASNATSLYSLINSEPMIIQGRPTFDAGDTVALGANFAVAGSYTIAIGQLDGVFEGTNVEIYLEDTVTGTINNLRTAPYSFTAVAGIVNDRFVLRYANAILGTNTVTAGQTAAFISGHQLHIDSDKAIVSVAVFDISGKLIGTYKGAGNQLEAQFDYAKGVYLAQLKFEDGSVVVKKLMN